MRFSVPRMTRRNTQRVILGLLLVLAVFGTFSGSNEPVMGMLEGTWLADIAYRLHFGNTILFNLSVGLLVSVFFWWLFVGIPQAQKRKMLRANLQRYYGYFKEEVVHILLSASGEAYDSNLPEQLLDHEKFKAYFKTEGSRHWYAALNGLQHQQGQINDLLVEMELLGQEISYVLNNIDIENENAHAFFKRLITHLYKLKNCTIYTGDHVKYLGNFIWEILAWWSFIDGQRKSDIVQDMIDSI